MIEYIKNLINNLIVYITTSCQAKLTAGENVTIAYDETTGETIISASGGGGGGGESIYKDFTVSLGIDGNIQEQLILNTSDEQDNNFINEKYANVGYIKIFIYGYTYQDNGPMSSPRFEYLNDNPKTIIKENNQNIWQFINEKFGGSNLSQLRIYSTADGSIAVSGYISQAGVNEPTLHIIILN